MAMRSAAKGYWREISAVVVLKVVGLVVLYGLFFGPANRPDLTPAAVAQHLGQSGGQR